MRILGVFLFCIAAAAMHAATVNNDDSCDISLMPAATLLLPYFEVDLLAPAGSGETTIFTVTNTTNLPQAAQVTLWTDYDYPVLSFNVFLTGYDVQSINLYDILARGAIAPDDGTGFDVSHVGELSGDYVDQIALDNPSLDEATCVDLPVHLPASLVARMQAAFTTGKVPAIGADSAVCNTAGGVHANAVGYATVDVVAACNPRLPNDPAYYAGVIGFDNVLGGDFMQVDGDEDFAQGSAMVHIRAIPEGGSGPVPFDRTFYGRFQSAAAPTLDARQPLPSIFSARWISGGPGGFETYFKIWREARTTSRTACSAFPAAGGFVGITDFVRFDEDENPETLAPPIYHFDLSPKLPAASLTNIDDERVFPPVAGRAPAGWIYLNLDAAAADGIATQNWVISSMRAEDRFSVDIDALTLGNGCSGQIPESEAVGGTYVIGPAPNRRPQ